MRIVFLPESCEAKAPRKHRGNMATNKKAVPAQSAGSDVDEFMRDLAHPLKAELELVRSLILNADPSISEGIKWNSASFRVEEYFATMHVKTTNAVQVIFHLGAKVKDVTPGMTVDDPNGLLEWLGKDRASVKLRDMNAIKANSGALREIVRQWIAYLR